MVFLPVIVASCVVVEAMEIVIVSPAFLLTWTFCTSVLTRPVRIIR